MNPNVALYIFIFLSFTLLVIEHKSSKNSVSVALWIPTLWLLIFGSRPIGLWLNPNFAIISNMGDESGSPYDRVVLLSLIFISFLILLNRNALKSNLIKDNSAILAIYFGILLSCLWSDFPFVTIKRWVKIFGVLLIGLVISSEKFPLLSFESTMRRCAYILIPISLLLVKYFPLYGRAYGRWEGQEMWTGVALHKNGLGVICAIMIFFLLFSLYNRLRNSQVKKSLLVTCADLFIISIAVYLMKGPADSYSATSVIILILGVLLYYFLTKSEFLTNFLFKRLSLHVILIIFLYITINSYFIPFVTSVMGRNENLTGRDEIWEAVSTVANRNPILGVGYGGYWGLQDYEVYSKVHVKSAHNGYLDVYLNLGLYGIILLFLATMTTAKRVKAIFSHNREWGTFSLCFLFMVLLYNTSESALFAVNFIWTIFIVQYISFTHIQEK